MEIKNKEELMEMCKIIAQYLKELCLEDDGYIKSEGAYHYLHMSRHTFNKYILPKVKMYFVGKEPRYKKSELNQAMEETVKEVRG